jgi:decaprenyl-phosphate phosphoribosyltransferase
VLKDYLEEMRLKHWYKALIVFSGPLFSGVLFSSDLLDVVFTFLAFGLIASSTYVLNDLNDIKDDRKHPKKKHRPVASGRIDEKSAVAFSGGLAGLAVGIALAVGSYVPHLVIGYFVLMALYTYRLKELPVVDAFVIATGFVMRALAGCFAAGIRITEWFYLVVFSFAIYLAFCKRLTEVIVAGREHKKSLSAYEHMAEAGIAISGAATLAMYAIYTLNRNGLLLWSVPLAFLGMLLHLRETYEGREVHEVLKKPEIAATGLAFVATVLLGIY